MTVSRQTGSLGHEITQQLARQLGLEVITHELVLKEWLRDVASRHELGMLAESPRFYLSPSGSGVSFADYFKNRLQEIVESQSVIILGLGAQVIFAGHPNALHIRIIASESVRLDRVRRSHRLKEQDAARFLELSDRKRRRFINTIYEQDWSDPGLYDLTLNTDHLSIEEAVTLLARLADVKKNAAALPAISEPLLEKKRVSFKHQSEEEFAKILDMHNIAWEYEPRTFPIQWDAEGDITKAFSPDFYLPNFDTYIEITTMDQKYVSEKKKKVRLLRELYPGININIVFKDDFYSLLKRFGLHEGVDKS